MKYLVYGGSGFGLKDPADILKELKIPYQEHTFDARVAVHFFVELTAEQLAMMCNHPDIDVMITKGREDVKVICFDQAGKSFRQR